MTPSIKLKKNIIQDDPRNLVCYVTLTVLSTVEMPKNIFVVKYIPPTSPNDPGSKSFYNVAYVDQLSDLSTTPENKRTPGFLLSHTVTKAFANRQVADKWCTEIYAEIQRLISTYALQGIDGTYTEVNVTAHTYTEEAVIDMSDVMVDITPSGSSVSSESSSSSDSSADIVEPVVEGGTEVTFDTIELTFDGKEITI